MATDLSDDDVFTRSNQNDGVDRGNEIGCSEHLSRIIGQHVFPAGLAAEDTLVALIMTARSFQQQPIQRTKGMDARHDA